jgi:hypothetical protein
MKLNSSIIDILRKAGYANNYSHLEETVPFVPLRAACRRVVEEHDDAVQRAKERKRAQPFSSAEDAQLRRGFTEERLSVAQLARQLRRRASAIQRRLITLGLLTLGDIRYQPGTDEPSSLGAASDKSGPLAEPDEKELAGGRTWLSVEETAQDELETEICEELNRQIEHARIQEEEWNTRLDEWEQEEARVREQQRETRERVPDDIADELDASGVAA